MSKRHTHSRGPRITYTYEVYGRTSLSPAHPMRVMRRGTYTSRNQADEVRVIIARDEGVPTHRIHLTNHIEPPLTVREKMVVTGTVFLLFGLLLLGLDAAANLW